MKHHRIHKKYLDIFENVFFGRVPVPPCFCSLEQAFSTELRGYHFPMRPLIDLRAISFVQRAYTAYFLLLLWWNTEFGTSSYLESPHRRFISFHTNSTWRSQQRKRGTQCVRSVRCPWLYPQATPGIYPLVIICGITDGIESYGIEIVGNLWGISRSLYDIPRSSIPKIILTCQKILQRVLMWKVSDD